MLLRLVMIVGCFASMMGVAQANIISWDREADTEGIREYRIYLCPTRNCVLSGTVANPTQLIGTVPQPPDATVLRPFLLINLAGKEGSVGVTAVDVFGNESLMSLSALFDFKLPVPPTKLGVQ